MKKLIVVLMTVFCVCAVASETTLFRDEDSGLVVKIPAVMNRTWNVSNEAQELEVTFFESSVPEQNFHLIAIGKLPSDQFDSDEMQEFVDHFKEIVFAEESELLFEVDVLPSLASEEYPATRYSFSMHDEDDLISFAYDIHFFKGEEYYSFVAVCNSPAIEKDPLVYELMNSVCFYEAE